MIEIKAGEKEMVFTTEESNYEKVFKHFQAYFLKREVEKIAKDLRLTIDDEYLYIPFFYELCCVTKDTGEITKKDGKQISVMDRLTIMHHLCCYQQFAQDSDRKVPFREIREAAVFETAYNRMALEPLKETFQGKAENLIKAGIKMGGIEEKFGDASVTLQAFPTISLTYIFWDGDEEFPAAANILFDNHITQWTHPESVPVLAETGTKRLMETARYCE